MNLRITDVSQIADLLWPPFEDRDGIIVLAGTQAIHPDQHASRSEAEAFYSHTHLSDHFDHEWGFVTDPDLGEEVPDPSHAEHMLSWAVAKRMAQMWLQKLRRDYPGEHFRVYASRLADPIVRFHKVRADEPDWLDDEAIARDYDPGDLIVLDSRRYSGAGT